MSELREIGEYVKRINKYWRHSHKIAKDVSRKMEYAMKMHKENKDKEIERIIQSAEIMEVT